MIKYTDLLKVQRKTLISDGMGGFTPTWSIVGTMSDVVCRIRQLKAAEMLINDKMSVDSTHRVYCSDIGVTSSDLLLVTERTSATSDVYDIETIDKRTEVGSGNFHHLEMDVKKVKR